MNFGAKKISQVNIRHLTNRQKGVLRVQYYSYLSSSFPAYFYPRFLHFQRILFHDGIVT